MIDSNAELIKTMDPVARAKLLHMRSGLAGDGYEFTPTQMIDEFRAIDEKFLEATDGLIGFDEAMEFLLPRPPYLGYFETIDEARDFRDRAEQLHKLTFEIVPVYFWSRIEGRTYWRVQEWQPTGEAA